MNYPIKELPVLKTERVIIREVELNDVNDLFEYAKKENVGPMAGWPPHKNLEQTREIILNMQKSRLTEDNIGVFSMIHKQNHKMIGTVVFIV